MGIQHGRGQVTDVQSGIRLDPRSLWNQELLQYSNVSVSGGRGRIPTIATDRRRKQFRKIERLGIRERAEHTVRGSHPGPDASQAAATRVAQSGD